MIYRISDIAVRYPDPGIPAGEIGFRLLGAG